jgi:D-alanyl-D-alanine carboxypeptidase
MKIQKNKASVSMKATQHSSVFKRNTAAMCTLLIALAATASVAHADATDDYVRGEMVKSKIPGITVAVIRDDKVIKQSAYGVASVELGVPITLDTPFPLASMTKVFTASAIMLLVQDGKITLDEPITKVLPQLPSTWSAVTIRHCLSHTSGLPDAITEDDINVTPLTGDRDELIETVTKLPVKPVGEDAVYNQLGYTLLGMIIEKESGMSYQDFVQNRVLKPSHITDANFGDAWSIIPGRTDLYTALDITKDHSKLLVHDHHPAMLNGKILHYGAKFMPDFLAPAGLLNGSMHDLINWEATLSEGKLLTPATLKEMTTPYKLNNGSDGDFGLAFLTVPFGAKSVSYGGGAATWRLSYPEQHLTVIVLTNLQGVQPQNLAAHIAALYDTAVASNDRK